MVLYDNHALSIWSFDGVDSSYCVRVFTKEGALTLGKKNPETPAGHPKYQKTRIVA